MLELEGERVMRCLRRPLLDDPQFYGYVLNASGHYQRGLLPGPGGVLDQPALLMSYLAVVEAARLDFQSQKDAQEVDKARRQAARNAR
jgi:hypothetical protein